MLQRFICTNKLLFQNAIMHRFIKLIVLEIASKSVKSSVIRIIILGRKEKRRKKRCTFQLKSMVEK